MVANRKQSTCSQKPTVEVAGRGGMGTPDAGSDVEPQPRRRKGMIIMVEKILGRGSRIGALLRGEYRNHKLTHGYTDADIDRRAMACGWWAGPLAVSQTGGTR